MYEIKEVLDNKTHKRSDKWGYRVGRKCEVEPSCCVGTPLIVRYESGSHFITTTIQSWEENKDGDLVVATQNTTYILKKLQKVIISNKVRCKSCGEVIESLHTHDFKWCSCRRVAVDGGKSYAKRCYSGSSPEETYEELSVTEMR